MRRLLLLVAALTLGGCSLNVDQPTDNPTDPATETFNSKLGVNIPTMTKTEHGVYYKDLSVGTGVTLTGTPAILFTYAGFLKDGSLFDQGQVTQPISLGGLVFGMQEGMQGMKEGGERLIVIPSALGYGSARLPGIPPNSTLVFDVRLDKVP